MSENTPESSAGIGLRRFARVLASAAISALVLLLACSPAAPAAPQRSAATAQQANLLAALLSGVQAILANLTSGLGGGLGGGSGGGSLSSGTGTPPPPSQLHIPAGFLGVANYSPNQVAYAGDLDPFNAKWWSGGFNLSDPTNQKAMLNNGYRFLPSFNTGYAMRSQGLTAVSSSTSKSADPHSCIDTACSLNTSAIRSEVQSVQSSLGGSGNYYDVGNEVDNYFSDDVSPSVYGAQFDAWVSAIRQGDPTAQIVAPSINSWSCCTTTATNPFGTAGDWFKAFISDYEQQHGGTKPPIDVLSMHLDNFDPNTGQVSTAQADKYLGEVQSFRQAADSLGYAGKPIWITEIGFLYQPAGPLTTAQSNQITAAINQLASNATTLNLQRLFWITSNDQTFINAGLRPLYDPNSPSSPSHPMPLSDLGHLVATLANQ